MRLEAVIIKWLINNKSCETIIYAISMGSYYQEYSKRSSGIIWELWELYYNGKK